MDDAEEEGEGREEEGGCSLTTCDNLSPGVVPVHTPVTGCG